MTENFTDLFQESLTTIDMTPGAVITGVVVDIDQERVIVHAGLKSEGIIPKDQFLDDQGELNLKTGDLVRVVMEAVDNGHGETYMSREKARRLEVWEALSDAYEGNKNVEGVITDRVKGGFIVHIDNVRAFLPGSLVDVRPAHDFDFPKNVPFEFKVIKLDAPRNNIVLSRRAVLEAETNVELKKLLESLEEGQELTGIVKNLTDYGVFVDLGGIDGLLHITDMAWRRIQHPSDIVEMGQEIKVKVLSFDRERNRVSLGLKQLEEDPWAGVYDRYPVGSKLKAKVTNVTDYGCFAELEEGVEGLVHVSEMAWSNKNLSPSQFVSVGEEIEVAVLSLEKDRRRISLGMRQCQENPWESFARQNPPGTRIKNTVNAVTDFGIFIGLGENMDGLVYLSDISWEEPGEKIIQEYTKGDEIEVVVLSADPDRQRVSLGIKQLEEDVFSEFLKGKGRGTLVEGTVIRREQKKATLQLAENVEAFMKSTEANSREKVEDLRTYLEDAQKIEAAISSIDHKKRVIWVSVKMLELREETQALEMHRKGLEEEPVVGTIGDLFKEEMIKKQLAAEKSASDETSASPANQAEGAEAIQAEAPKKKSSEPVVDSVIAGSVPAKPEPSPLEAASEETEAEKVPKKKSSEPVVDSVIAGSVPAEPEPSPLEAASEEAEAEKVPKKKPSEPVVDSVIAESKPAEPEPPPSEAVSKKSDSQDD